VSIGESIAVLSGLRARVAAQPAARPRVRKARRLIVAGLASIVSGYRELTSAFEETASDPEAAKTAAEASLHAAASGRAQLQAGVRLLA
jgi:hypothetical protein